MYIRISSVLTTRPNDLIIIQDDDYSSSDRCPEWSKSDIISQLSVILKICGIVSFLCMLYIIGALVVSAVTRNNLKNYKSDYI